jgi:hypothetical protein
VQRFKDGPESLSAANGRAAQKHGRHSTVLLFNRQALLTGDRQAM